MDHLVQMRVLNGRDNLLKDASGFIFSELNDRKIEKINIYGLSLMTSKSATLMAKEMLIRNLMEATWVV